MQFKDVKAQNVTGSKGLVPAVITSERYTSDRYYSKDTLFYHFLRNSSDQRMKVIT